VREKAISKQHTLSDTVATQDRIEVNMVGFLGLGKDLSARNS
jgi:hypothetical protein